MKFQSFSTHAFYLLLHEGRHHVIADHAGGDGLVVQLVGGQPGALVVRTGLGAVRAG